MKKIIAAIAFVFVYATAAKAQQAGDTARKEGIQTLTIKTSAVCDMCKETLEKAMAYEKGVKESSLDVESKVLTVQYDAKKTSPEKIRKAVTMTGYDADGIPADARSYDKLNACCKKDYKH